MSTPEPDFWSNPKPPALACVCGCGLVGQARKRAWQDNLGPHIRACKCRRCEGGRHKGRAGIRERRIARDTGGQRSELSGALSGYDGRAGLDVWEESTNVAITRGLFKWWSGKGVQSKVERLMNQSGYRRHLVLWDEVGNGLVVTPFTDWADLVKSAGDAGTMQIEGPAVRIHPGPRPNPQGGSDMSDGTARTLSDGSGHASSRS